MGELNTQAVSHHTFGRLPCVLCGPRHEQDNAAIFLYDGYDHDIWSDVIGDVCPACVLVGPKEEAERMREHARKLRDQADELDTLADGVENITDWAMLEDLARAELTSEARLREIPELQRVEWVQARLAERTANLELRTRSGLGDAEAKAELRARLEESWAEGTAF